MTNSAVTTIHTHTPIRTLARAAHVALVTALALTLVAPAAAHAAGETAAVSPATAAAGESVDISGSGFQPGEAVEVLYGGSTIASGGADANGDFSVSGTIPADIPEGGHPMDVVGALGSMVSLDYVVAAPTAPAPTPPAPGGSGSSGGSSSSPSTSAAPTPTPDRPIVKRSAADIDQADVLSERAGTIKAGFDGDDASLGTEGNIWLTVIAGLVVVGLTIPVVSAWRDRKEELNS
jgi:hypothetical protein